MNKLNLSTPQETIFYTKKVFDNTPIANVGGTYKIKGLRYDPELWTKAINLYLKNNEGIRARIKETLPPSQYFAEYEEETFEIIDLTNIPEEKRQKLYLTWMQEIFNDKLYTYRIIKYSEAEHGLFIVKDHMILDGFTQGIELQQLKKAYTSLLNNEEYSVVKPQYSKFLEREQKYLITDRYAKDKAFWQMQWMSEINGELVDEEPILTNLTITPTDNPESSRYQKIINEDLTQRIKTLSSETGVSVAALFETALFAYMKIVTGEEKITIGVPLLNRFTRDEREISGMMVNTLPFVIRIPKDMTFESLSKAVTTKKSQMFRAMQYPLSEIQKDLQERFGYNGKIFDVVFNYQNASIFEKGEENNIEAETEWIPNGYSGFGLTISFDDRDQKGEYVVNIDYQNEAYSLSNVEAIFERILLIVEQIIENRDIKIDELNVLTEKDMQEYALFNNVKEIDVTKTVVELFEEQVRLTPDNVALVFGNDIRLTYRELNNLANSLAHNIKAKGLEKGSIIPIVGERDYLTIVASMAIAKAGYAFCLLDVNEYPKDRIDSLVQTCGAKLCLTYGNCDYSYPNLDIMNIDNQDTWTNEYSNLDVKIGLNDTYVVLHTSGSSGMPKAVLIPHDAASSMAKNNPQFIANCDYSLSFTTMTFDAFIMDTLLPLLNGKQLILSTATEQKSLKLTNDLIAKYPHSYTFFTPTRLRYYLQELKEEDYWHNIDVLVVGGESFDKTLVDLVKERTNARMYNIYGPTEITVFNSLKEIVDYNITIGKPAVNYQVYILNGQGQLLPPGAIGEIIVSGIGVANGYVGLEHETNEKFTKINGKKAYKTGDLGYINVLGELVILGRKDFQHKINGIRFEAGEVEAVVNTFIGIKQSVVALKKHNNTAYVIAYYESDEIVDEEKLTAYLETKLPLGVVPSIFVAMEKLPTTRTGKLVPGDRLPAPDFEKINKSNFVLPQNPIQTSLVEIWKQILRKEEISINASWKSLGGTSLDLLHMLDAVEKKFGGRIRPSDLAKSPTIESLETVVNGKNVKVNLLEKFDLTNITVNTDKIKTGNAILLAGASGWLASHILIKLLETTNQKVYCLVRDINKFKELIRLYFGEDVSKYNERIEVIKGDISKPNLGLENNIYAKLEDEVVTIVNMAANVKHYGPLDEFIGPNIDGVYNLLVLAARANAHMHHGSTVSVSGQGLTSQKQTDIEFNENNLNVGQGYEENVYIWTKYVGEELIHIFQEKGLLSSIYRIGRISSRKSDGLFQHNSSENGFAIIVDLIEELKIIPRFLEEMPVQMAPVDECAGAITTLINEIKDSRTYHIYNPNLKTLRDFLAHEGVEYQRCTPETFIEKLTNVMAKDSRYVLVAQYIKDAIENPSNNTIGNEITQAILETTGFRYSDIQEPIEYEDDENHGYKDKVRQRTPKYKKRRRR